MVDHVEGFDFAVDDWPFEMVLDSVRGLEYVHVILNDWWLRGSHDIVDYWL